MSRRQNVIHYRRHYHVKKRRLAARPGSQHRIACHLRRRHLWQVQLHCRRQGHPSLKRIYPLKKTTAIVMKCGQNLAEKRRLQKGSLTNQKVAYHRRSAMKGGCFPSSSSSSSSSSFSTSPGGNTKRLFNDRKPSDDRRSRGGGGTSEWPQQQQ